MAVMIVVVILLDMKEEDPTPLLQILIIINKCEREVKLFIFGRGGESCLRIQCVYVSNHARI